jgi:hypothetical protein
MQQLQNIVPLRERIPLLLFRKRTRVERRVKGVDVGTRESIAVERGHHALQHGSRCLRLVGRVERP